MSFRSLFSRPKVNEVSAADAAERQKAGAVIVDVREAGEWREGHIPGAIHIPLSQFSRKATSLDKSKELIMVCRSGNRSATATSALTQAGFANVSNLSGGMIAWSRQRLPVER